MEAGQQHERRVQGPPCKAAGCMREQWELRGRHIVPLAPIPAGNAGAKLPGV